MTDLELYDAAVARLLGQRPEGRPQDLERFTTLVELLGRPDQAYPSIQVAGSNGKGSTARMISSLLGALGLTAGTYTGPHLQDVRERLQVGNETVGREDLRARMDELAPFLDEVDARHAEPVTFFEAVTALAYAHFADAPVDVGVFEAGSGGRWDATALARGEVSVLTRVDHAAGPDAGGAGGEQVSIVKDGAVVVTAPQPPQVLAVLADACAPHEARLVQVGQDVQVTGRRLAVGGQHLDLRAVTGEFPGVYVPLHGAHQADNAACALAAVEAFLGFAGGLDPEVVREGFAAVRAPGRLEVVRRTDASTVVLDSAHNPPAAQALRSALEAEFAFRHRVLVLGMLTDTDVEATMRPLLETADHVVVTAPHSPHATAAEHLAQAARAAGTTVETAEDVVTALDLASGLAAEEDAVVVTGSLPVVGEARWALGLGVD